MAKKEHSDEAVESFGMVNIDYFGSLNPFGQVIDMFTALHQDDDINHLDA